MDVTGDAELNTRRLEPNNHIVFSKARGVWKAYAQQPESSPISKKFAMVDEEQVWAYCLFFTILAQDFRFFVTEQPGQPHRMGMGPVEVPPNDRAVIFAGGRMPFMLRPQTRSCTATDGADRPCYALLGLAYVDGIMDGASENGGIDQDDANREDTCLG